MPPKSSGEGTRVKEVVFSKKSLYKTISWRIVSIILAFTISYVIMGSASQASMFTVVHSVVATLLYYWHEVAWKVARRRGWVSFGPAPQPKVEYDKESVLSVRRK